MHLATRDAITRLSVAMGILNHSTNDCITVNVRVKDVEMASTFYINMLVELELGLYKGMIEGATHLNNEEMNEIDTEFEMEHYKILRLIVTGPKGSPEIARLLNLSPVTIKRKYETLLKYDLIKTVTGKGVTLTKKGIYFVKKRLNIEKPEKPEKIEIRRDGINFDTMILMKRGVVSFETLNIDNTNNGDNIINTVLDGVSKNLGQLIKEYQKKNKEKCFKNIGEKINKIIKEDIMTIKKDENRVDTSHLDSIIVSTMIPSTEVEEKLTFFRNNGYSQKIEEIMQKKPKHDWSINNIADGLGFADIKSRKALNLFLEEITADPKNPTRIRRVDEEGLFWRLVEGDKK